MDIETSTEPPECDHDEGDGDSVYISVSVHGGLYRDASTIVETDDVTQVADALIECIRSVAAMWGSELQVALARRLS